MPMLGVEGWRKRLYCTSGRRVLNLNARPYVDGNPWLQHLRSRAHIVHKPVVEGSCSVPPHLVVRWFRRIRNIQLSKIGRNPS